MAGSRARVPLLLALGLLSAGTHRGQPPIELRLHHVHVRVDDPGEVLDEVAGRLGGSKVILQGHGPAVRAGREYIVLDREDGRTHETQEPPIEPAAAYADARAWLAAAAAAIIPDDFGGAAISRGVAGRRVAAFAFAASDLEKAVAALRAQGRTPMAHSADGARFRLPSGAILEVVPETEGPDAFWCPMHPTVRAPFARPCPLCGMALVPIPPPQVGEYKLDVTVRPGRRGRGIAGLRIVVREPQTLAPVRQFLDVHERPLHLFLISRDLERFAHVHPTLGADGAFELDERFPDGEYMVVADFVPVGGTPQMLQKMIATAGSSGSMSAGPRLVAGPAEQTIEGLRIRIDASGLRSLESGRVRFHAADASTGAPATDLEPYLGASGHLLVVSSDLTSAIHAHPEGAATGGPEVVFDPILPAPGLYKVWLQVQRKGRVVTAPFVIEAR
jgi:hypothetical protein